jgi:hypothetical protein
VLTIFLSLFLTETKKFLALIFNQPIIFYLDSEPAWAIELLERVRALEMTSVSPVPGVSHAPDMEMDTHYNSAVVERTSDLEFIPYPDFIDALTGIARDFFRNPLLERELQRYLGQWSRDMEREYSTSVLNEVHVSIY